MTLMRRGRDPFAGFGSLQEAFRDMLTTWPFGDRGDSHSNRADHLGLRS